MPPKLTPMLQQYRRIRQGIPRDVLLLFRLGDFYEMFFEDAKEAAPLLNVALTRRNGYPMCGIPYHAAEVYIARLIRAGRRVAVCDQVGEIRPGKLVARELTQIVSAGTVAGLDMLESKRANYLAAVTAGRGRFGLAWTDVSTGEFRLAELDGPEALDAELARLRPAEILVSEQSPDLLRDPPAPLVQGDAYSFEYDHAYFILREHFHVHSLDGFGIEDAPLAVGAAGAILHHLTIQMRRDVRHLRRLLFTRSDRHLALDAATQHNLELVESRGEGRDTSLLAALDRTVTPMGARLLRDWVLHPLRDPDEIRARQGVIAEMLAEPRALSAMREAFRGMRDVARILGRLSQGSGNPRDLAALRTSLGSIPDLRAALRALSPIDPGPQGALGQALLVDLREQPELIDLLARALVDEPPVSTRDGGLIRDGHDSTLDELRRASRDGKDWIAQLQEREIARTGIKSLKIRYNAVFGYYIEVTRSNLGLVPPDYTRRQTTANAERFVTPALKEMEDRIRGADERARQLEASLFLGLREQVLARLDDLQRAAAAAAALDALGSLAETARLHGYTRPRIDDAPGIRIVEGRHPVLEQLIEGERFVPNDTLLDGGENRVLVITGPNMARKSTYIRQVALIAILAHIGSYVPAASASIGLCDRIFTRVGASDDLGRGRSTFMVEMNETAAIVNGATERSLVVLDEIGRGTSTFDGISIAWSVAEYLHDTVRALTLFATHYHELAELEATRSGVKNYNVAVREWNDEIVFLRKIARGTADRSYGIQVARLAGLPPEIIERSKEILKNLEAGEFTPDGKPALARSRRPPRARRPPPGGGGEPGPEEQQPQLRLL